MAKAFFTAARRRALLILTVVFLFVAVFGVAYAQIAEGIDALTRATNETDLIGLFAILFFVVILIGVASPVYFNMAANRRLDRMEAASARLEATYQNMLTSERARLDLAETELKGEREKTDRYVNAFGRIADRQDKRMAVMEKAMTGLFRLFQYHTRDADRRTDVLQKEMKEHRLSNEAENRKLQIAIGQHFDKMTQQLGDRIAEGYSLMTQGVTSAINALSEKLPTTLVVAPNVGVQQTSDAAAKPTAELKPDEEKGKSNG